MSYPNSRGGYSNVPMGGDPRQSEAWALTEAARRIADAKDRFGAGPEFLAAVRLNWRLWTIFQAELSSAESQVPDEIRANMLSLCNFVDKTSVDIIADPVVDKANILITINRHIAAGLFSTPSGEQSGGVQAPPTSSGFGGISA
ncbi:MAG: flagellar biosynthesis regulator FlaF [Bacteroidales bacterium]